MKPVIGVNLVFQSLNEGGRHFYMVTDNYVDAVYRAGGLPLLIPPLPNLEAISEFMEQINGMVFIGGHDYPPAWYGQEPHPQTSLERERADFDLALMKAALAGKLPVLGICAGCQLLSIAHGGRLIQHVENHRNGMHGAVIEKAGRFSSIINARPGDVITVNTSHHQAVDPACPGKELSVTVCDYGGGVEVIERTGELMVMGIQFHVERMPELAPRFFGALVSACRTP
jgi:gamma-glutamyl-gamma-aminobutyrate hydrolase PuuD